MGWNKDDEDKLYVFGKARALRCRVEELAVTYRGEIVGDRARRIVCDSWNYKSVDKIRP